MGLASHSHAQFFFRASGSWPHQGQLQSTFLSADSSRSRAPLLFGRPDQGRRLLGTCNDDDASVKKASNGWVSDCSEVSSKCYDDKVKALCGQTCNKDAPECMTTVPTDAPTQVGKCTLDCTQTQNRNGCSRKLHQGESKTGESGGFTMFRNCPKGELYFPNLIPKKCAQVDCLYVRLHLNDRYLDTYFFLRFCRQMDNVNLHGEARLSSTIPRSISVMADLKFLYVSSLC